MTMVPRCVVVERPTEYRELIARHGTERQAAFYLAQRGVALDGVLARDRLQGAARTSVLAAVPPHWRRAQVLRQDLDRFLFEPEDIVVVLGQDGLVANVAKYLHGQPVIGLNADADHNEGVLVRHAPADAREIICAVAEGGAHVRRHTMVRAVVDDGQTLIALNEVFVGHASHQSARYELFQGEQHERQSSSGLIVSTGTGATGWAASLHRERHSALRLPEADDPRLAYFVREAWPSRATGATLTEGIVDPGSPLRIRCENAEGAVAFGDGIEEDRIALDWGQGVTIDVAPQTLALVV
jgi:hypothetical protein